MNISIFEGHRVLILWTVHIEPGCNHLLVRANHYPGLKTAKLSSTALEKMLVGKLKTFFRPPNLLQSLKSPIVSLL